MCSLWLLLIVVVVLFTYLIIISIRRYNADISCLEILETRLNVNEGKQNSIADIDRELQLVARILESEHSQLSADYKR